jgi:uncharacterized metal-binding protein
MSSRGTAAENTAKILAILGSQEMCARTVAYRAGFESGVVMALVKKGILEVCGREAGSVAAVGKGRQRSKGIPIVRRKK